MGANAPMRSQALPIRRLYYLIAAVSVILFSISILLSAYARWNPVQVLPIGGLALPVLLLFMPRSLPPFPDRLIVMLSWIAMWGALLVACISLLLAFDATLKA